MIPIVKEGRAAYSHEGDPNKLCPYRAALSPEQLAWSIGWYKEKADRLEQELQAMKGISHVAQCIYRAELKGRRDYKPELDMYRHCPFAEKAYREAYFIGWNMAEATFNDEPITSYPK